MHLECTLVFRFHNKFSYFSCSSTVISMIAIKCIVAPFLTSIQPDEVKDTYLIFALDGWLGPKKTNTKAEKFDAVIETELNELQC